VVRAKLVPDVLKASFLFLVKPEEEPFSADDTTYQKIGCTLLTALTETIPYKLVFEPCLKTAVRLMQVTLSVVF
jgi:hypothetical protein